MFDGRRRGKHVTSFLRDAAVAVRRAASVDHVHIRFLVDTTSSSFMRANTAAKYAAFSSLVLVSSVMLICR